MSDVIPFNIIVAVDRCYGIGRDGGIPWKLPPDMAEFKRKTVGVGNGSNAVIMGRKTWESIPAKFRPLPGRTNVVLSRVPYPDGPLFASSLDKALHYSRCNEQRWVIGGGELYREALQHPGLCEIHLTFIDADFHCDVDFPNFSRQKFQLYDVGVWNIHDGLEFQYRVYRDFDAWGAP